jgi:hypothetical protein
VVLGPSVHQRDNVETIKLQSHILSHFLWLCFNCLIFPSSENFSGPTGSYGTVTCSGYWSVSLSVTYFLLETPFGLLLRFTYDVTSRHNNYFYNVTRTRLTASSLTCWFLVFRCWSDLTFHLWSVLVPLLWRCVSDRLLWSARLYFLPPWNRVMVPRIEDTLSKGNFSSVVSCCHGNNFC